MSTAEDLHTIFIFLARIRRYDGTQHLQLCMFRSPHLYLYLYYSKEQLPAIVSTSVMLLLSVAGTCLERVCCASGGA